jgi:hypothetical protein
LTRGTPFIGSSKTAMPKALLLLLIARMLAYYPPRKTNEWR